MLRTRNLGELVIQIMSNSETPLDFLVLDITALLDLDTIYGSYCGLEWTEVECALPFDLIPPCENSCK
jgi:hypothetical protein